jgi:hypothetical protein
MAPNVAMPPAEQHDLGSLGSSPNEPSHCYSSLRPIEAPDDVGDDESRQRDATMSSVGAQGARWIEFRRATRTGTQVAIVATTSTRTSEQASVVRSRALISNARVVRRRAKST